MKKPISSSIPSELDDRVVDFERKSRMTRSAIVEAALRYWLASSEPGFYLLKGQIEARLNKIEMLVGDDFGALYGWRKEVDGRLDALEEKV